MANFSDALDAAKAGLKIKREIIKNDTVIIKYGNTLCQMSQNTGVRYPYVPLNEDVFAEDWIIINPDTATEAKDNDYYLKLTRLILDALYIDTHKYDNDIIEIIRSNINMGYRSDIIAEKICQFFGIGRKSYIGIVERILNDNSGKIKLK